MSFYARTSDVGGFSLPIRYAIDNTSDLAVEVGKANLTTSWQKFSFIFTPTTFDSLEKCKFFMLFLGLLVKVDIPVNLAGIKLEYGDKATPFEMPDYTTELLKCQDFKGRDEIPRPNLLMNGDFKIWQRKKI